MAHHDDQYITEENARRIVEPETLDGLKKEGRAWRRADGQVIFLTQDVFDAMARRPGTSIPEPGQPASTSSGAIPSPAPATNSPPAEGSAYGTPTPVEGFPRQMNEGEVSAPAFAPQPPPSGPPFPAPAMVHPPPPQNRPAPSSSRWASLVALLIGAAATVAFYFALILVSPIIPAFVEKFTSRGWTPYAAVWLTAWSLVQVGMRRSGASVIDKLIARWEARSIPEHVDVGTVQRTYGDLMHGAPNDPVREGVELIVRAANNGMTAEGIGSTLTDRVDAQHGQVDLAYSVPRVLLWAIPVLGFIGTVIGVGDAIAGFAESLAGGAQEVEQIKAALTEVTRNLGVAFDTTLVGLALSVIVMLAISVADQADRAQIDRVNQFLRRLLSALALDGPARGQPVSAEQLGDLKQELVERFQAAFTQAADQVQSTLTAVNGATGSVATSVSRMSDSLNDFKQLDGRLAKLEATTESLAKLADELGRLATAQQAATQSVHDALREVRGRPIPVSIRVAPDGGEP